MTTFNIDTSHSSIGFAVRHLVISKVRGRFTSWTGEVELDEADVTRSRVRVSIDAASIATDEEKRDAHLRSADFFDVEKFPTLTFVSKRVEDRGEGALRVTGDLTIHGITREVTLDVEDFARGRDPWGGERIGLTARTSVDRKEFGLHWNAALETGGFVVGDKIEINLEVEAVKAAVAQVA